MLDHVEEFYKRVSFMTRVIFPFSAYSTKIENFPPCSNIYVNISGSFVPDGKDIWEEKFPLERFCNDEFFDMVADTIKKIFSEAERYILDNHTNDSTQMHHACVYEHYKSMGSSILRRQHLKNLKDITGDIIKAMYSEGRIK